jgi:predicted DNA-binding transcriptional regulator YafY
MIEEILWYGDDVVVLEPESIRDSVISRLQLGVDLYG